MVLDNLTTKAMCLQTFLKAAKKTLKLCPKDQVQYVLHLDLCPNCSKSINDITEHVINMKVVNCEGVCGLNGGCSCIYCNHKPFEKNLNGVWCQKDV